MRSQYCVVLCIAMDDLQKVNSAHRNFFGSQLGIAHGMTCLRNPKP